MSDIKKDVKAIVKVFIQVFITTLARESTKIIIKNLSEIQKKKLEANLRYMSDDELAEYFVKNPFFKNALQNTIKSAYDTQSAKETGFLPRKLESIYEAVNYFYNPINALILPSPRAILSFLTIIAVLITLANTTAGVVIPELTKFPVANFSSNVTNGTAPLTVQFYDSSQNATAWFWDFGDGSNSTAQNPIHTYSDPKLIYPTALNYKVKLTVNNAYYKNSKSAKIKVLIQPLSPIANFSSSVILKVPLFLVMFTDKSKYATGCNWDFGDGTDSGMRNPIHIYSTVGNYTVNLTVTNANISDSILAIINVSGQTVDPVANFTSNVSNGNVPLFVQFTDKSQIATGWNWIFGDGTNSTEKNPRHVYSAAGIYTVNLAVSNANITASKTAVINVSGEAELTDANGKANVTNGTNSTNATKYVLKQQSGFSGSSGGSSGRTLLPVANFSSNVTNGTVPLSVQFTDLSDAENGWRWDFGDGTNSTEKNPIHIYSAAGNYTVNLTVSNANSITNLTYAIINVLKMTPPIFWGSPADIVYGTPLNGTQLNALTSADGTFVYTPDNGTVLGAGIHFLKVYFAPKDTANYNTISKNVTINISKATPIITWSDPANITYRTTLSSTQLNASASVPGTFIYEPEAGVVLSPGAHILSVNFIPDDALNYNTASQNVTINVTKSRGQFAYIANKGSNTISVIDTESYNVTDTIQVEGWPVGVALIPDGTKLYVANSGSGTVSVIDTRSNTVTATVPVGINPYGVAVTPDGTKVYVTNSDSKIISIISTATNTVTKRVELESNPIGIEVTPDGKKVYVTLYNSNSVSVIDSANDNVIKTVKVGSGPGGISVSPTGTEVYVMNYVSNTVSVIDTENDNVVATVNLESMNNNHVVNPYGLAVTSDGTKVYLVNYGSNNVSVINTETYNVTATVKVGSGPEGIIVNPTGKVYVTNADDNTVSVIDAANNAVIARTNAGIRPSGLAM